MLATPAYVTSRADARSRRRSWRGWPARSPTRRPPPWRSRSRAMQVAPSAERIRLRRAARRGHRHPRRRRGCRRSGRTARRTTGCCCARSSAARAIRRRSSDPTPSWSQTSLAALRPLLGIERRAAVHARLPLGRAQRAARSRSSRSDGRDRPRAGAPSGLFVTGSGFRGVGIPDCVATAARRERARPHGSQRESYKSKLRRQKSN